MRDRAKVLPEPATATTPTSRKLSCASKWKAQASRCSVLVMPSAITFASGSDELSLEAAQLLNKLAGSLKQFPESIIEITGYTDNVGGEQMNLYLSKKRAVSVGRYLVAGC